MNHKDATHRRPPDFDLGNPLPPDEFKRRVRVHEELVHVTAEVHRCHGEHPHRDGPAVAAPPGT